MGVVAGLELRFGQIIARAKLLRLLARGILEQRERLDGVLLAQQHDSAVQFRFIESGLEFQGLAIFGDGLRIPLKQRVSHRQIEVGEVVFGIRIDGFAECLHGRVVLTFVEGLHPLGGVIGLSKQEESREGPHTSIISPRDCRRRKTPVTSSCPCRPLPARRVSPTRNSAGYRHRLFSRRIRQRVSSCSDAAARRRARCPAAIGPA